MVIILVIVWLMMVNNGNIWRFPARHAGSPQMVGLVYTGKIAEEKMDDDWGYPYFQNSPQNHVSSAKKPPCKRVVLG